MPCRSPTRSLTTSVEKELCDGWVAYVIRGELRHPDAQHVYHRCGEAAHADRDYHMRAHSVPLVVRCRSAPTFRAVGSAFAR